MPARLALKTGDIDHRLSSCSITYRDHASSVRKDLFESSGSLAYRAYTSGGFKAIDNGIKDLLVRKF